MYPDIQEKVYQELCTLYNSPNEESDFEIISKLDYMEMVIKESLRVFPVGPFLARETLTDTTLCKQNIF